jgi:glycosyltransferase involved in cell wall biosynthesis
MHCDEAMRILHVITSLSVGGAEQMLLKLLGAPELGDFEQHVIALLPKGPLAEAMRGKCTTVRELNLLGSVPVLGGTAALAVRARQLAPDIVQGWLYHGNLGALAARAVQPRRVPLIWGIRQSLATLEGENRWARFAIHASRKLSRIPDCMTFNSMTSLSQHERFGFLSERMRYLPNGFDVGRFRPDGEARARRRAEWQAGDEAVVFGLVARVHPAKDYPSFLAAARSVADINRNAVFVLCGTGADPANTELVGLVQRLGLAGHVRLLGESTRVHEVMAGLDVLVSSSCAIEAFSNSVGEAMSCGVPCVVTAVGDSPSVVADTGVVVPARDPARLAVAMIEMIAIGTAARTELGQRARERILAEYNLDTVAARYGALWRELCGPG